MITAIPIHTIVPSTLEAASRFGLAELAEGAQLGDEPGWVVNLVIAMLSVAFLLAVVRTLKGPTVPDRVVALDLLAYFIIGAIGVYAIRTNTPSLIMIAIVMGLILFLGTTAFALYLERRARP